MNQERVGVLFRQGLEVASMDIPMFCLYPCCLVFGSRLVPVVKLHGKQHFVFQTHQWFPSPHQKVTNLSRILGSTAFLLSYACLSCIPLIPLVLCVCACVSVLLLLATPPFLLSGARNRSVSLLWHVNLIVDSI